MKLQPAELGVSDSMNYPVMKSKASAGKLNIYVYIYVFVDIYNIYI